MANSIDYASIFQSALDKQMLQEMVTSKMEAQASQVKYNGGDEIKILKLTLEGLGDYSRTSSTHFPTGDITTSWETHTFDMDRGKEFSLDRMDNDEQFVDIAGQIMSEFQRVHVAPEVDAYRFEAIWDKAVDESQVQSYTPAVSTIFGQLKDDLEVVQDVIGETEPLTIYMSYAASTILDQADDIEHKLEVSSFAGEVKSKVRSLDGVPIVKVPSVRFKTDYTFSATDGFSASATAMNINWVIAADRAVIGIVKTDKPRIFSPDVNQSADGWKFQYRKYHTLIIPDNKMDGVYVDYTPIDAPALTATIAGGSASGTTSFTATAGTGNTLAYVLGAASPGVNYQDLIATGSPTGAVVDYTSGADITASTGQVLTMLELDSNSRVVKLLEDTLESGDIT